jgi:TatD DNase family protein
MQLIDTHVHLDEIKDSEEALKRAKGAGLKAIVAVGMGLRSNEATLLLAQSFPGFVCPALGLHPWRLAEENFTAIYPLLEKELARCLALGEVGLDFAIDTPREKQEEIFSKLLALAAEMDKPVLCHARRAWAECFHLLKFYKIKKAVFHWYSGPIDLLPQIFGEGYLISATPAAAYSQKHQLAIHHAPLTNLLLETDAPEVYRGKASEPQDLLVTLQAVSAIKKRPLEEIAEQTYRNAQEFFSWEL